jgi:hypothetical protein
MPHRDPRARDSLCVSRPIELRYPLGPPTCAVSSHPATRPRSAQIHTTSISVRLRLYRGEPGKLEGKRQDKLPNRHGGKHAVEPTKVVGNTRAFSPLSIGPKRSRPSWASQRTPRSHSGTRSRPSGRPKVPRVPIDFSLLRAMQARRLEWRATLSLREEPSPEHAASRGAREVHPDL